MVYCINMGVDNYANLFVGKTVKEFFKLGLVEKLVNVLKLYKEERDFLLEDPEAFWDEYEGDGNIEITWLNDDERVIGFYIAGTDSYGWEKIKNARKKIKEAKDKFRKIFGVEADVILFNYLSY